MRLNRLEVLKTCITPHAITLHDMSRSPRHTLCSMHRKFVLSSSAYSHMQTFSTVKRMRLRDSILVNSSTQESNYRIRH